ncbi:NAD(P)-dependent alcohol dehydrogenase [Galbitalea soli]|nr:NAD(P)-dependent alcohol dehydrogenase [Galbitalea soli]NYJ30436.1 L-iditol 2-dehydrogenase [Galbitalea soli]
MRAALLERAGVVETSIIEVPPLDADQVLIEVSAVGVCGSDVHYFEHGRVGPFVVEAPIILGHELSGTIVDVGAAVDRRRIGERVAVEPQRPCRVCTQCKAGRYNLCPDMEFFATPPINGAFCEFVAIQSDFAHAVPDTVSDEAAALIEPLSVAIWACQRAQVGVGSRVLVAGAGPIGVIVAQTARAFGASEVIVTDVDAQRRAFALEHGATVVLDPAHDDVSTLGVDAFVDASGVPSAVIAGIEAVRPAGIAMLVGLGHEMMALPVSAIQSREIWVSGVFRYANTWPTGIELVASGRVNLDALVSGRFGLDEVDRALSVGREPGQMKVVVHPWKGWNAART